MADLDIPALVAMYRLTFSTRRLTGWVSQVPWVRGVLTGHRWEGVPTQVTPVEGRGVSRAAALAVGPPVECSVPSWEGLVLLKLH